MDPVSSPPCVKPSFSAEYAPMKPHPGPGWGWLSSATSQSSTMGPSRWKTHLWAGSARGSGCPREKPNQTTDHTDGIKLKTLPRIGADCSCAAPLGLELFTVPYPRFPARGFAATPSPWATVVSRLRRWSTGLARVFRAPKPAATGVSTRRKRLKKNVAASRCLLLC